MKKRPNHGNIDQDSVLYSHLFYQSDFNGRGEGWYFILSRNQPYGPFPDKEVANTILEGLVERLDKGESEEDIRDLG